MVELDHFILALPHHHMVVLRFKQFELYHENFIIDTFLPHARVGLQSILALPHGRPRPQCRSKMLLGLGLPHSRGGIQSILALLHGRPGPQCRAKMLLCLGLQ